MCVNSVAVYPNLLGFTFERPTFKLERAKNDGPAVSSRHHPFFPKLIYLSAVRVSFIQRVGRGALAPLIVNYYNYVRGRRIFVVALAVFSNWNRERITRIFLLGHIELIFICDACNDTTTGFV